MAPALRVVRTVRLDSDVPGDVTLEFYTAVYSCESALSLGRAGQPSFGKPVGFLERRGARLLPPFPKAERAGQLKGCAARNVRGATIRESCAAPPRHVSPTPPHAGLMNVLI